MANPPNTKHKRKTGNFIPALHKFTQDRLEILLNSFYEGRFTVISKLDKKVFQENYRSVSHMNTEKSSNKY